LREIKAGSPAGWHQGRMVDEDASLEAASRSASCSGGGGRPHAAVEIVVAVGAVATCPVCGRRFRGGDAAVRIGPAAWPKEE
jgi:hypothetical protein